MCNEPDVFIKGCTPPSDPSVSVERFDDESSGSSIRMLNLFVNALGEHSDCP